jgi:hypothetical protein
MVRFSNVGVAWSGHASNNPGYGRWQIVQAMMQMIGTVANDGKVLLGARSSGRVRLAADMTWINARKSGQIESQIFGKSAIDVHGVRLDNSFPERVKWVPAMA